VDIMTQEQARDLLIKLRMVVQKTRSNLAEVVELKPEDYDNEGHPGFVVMNDLNPLLFPAKGKIGVLEALNRILAKEVIEPGDAFNALNLAHRCAPAVAIYPLIQGEELPAAISVMTAMMKGA